MARMYFIYVFIILCFIELPTVACRDVCSRDYYNVYYCEGTYKCCGEKTCCNIFSRGVITGIVFGCIVGLFILGLIIWGIVRLTVYLVDKIKTHCGKPSITVTPQRQPAGVNSQQINGVTINQPEDSAA